MNQYSIYDSNGKLIETVNGDNITYHSGTHQTFINIGQKIIAAIPSTYLVIKR